jgi:hypothetical protein
LNPELLLAFVPLVPQACRKHTLYRSGLVLSEGNAHTDAQVSCALSVFVA